MALPRGLVVCHSAEFMVVTESQDVLRVWQRGYDHPGAASVSCPFQIAVEVIFFVSTFSIPSVLQ